MMREVAKPVSAQRAADAALAANPPVERVRSASRRRSARRFPRRLRLLAALAFAGTAALAIDAHAQGIERGRQLYENHCRACHTAEVHGRDKRIALGVSDLRAIVDRWQRNQKLNWGAQEIEDVVQYLGTTQYFFIGHGGAQTGVR